MHIRDVPHPVCNLQFFMAIIPESSQKTANQFYLLKINRLEKLKQLMTSNKQGIASVMTNENR